MIRCPVCPDQLAQCTHLSHKWWWWWYFTGWITCNQKKCAANEVNKVKMEDILGLAKTVCSHAFLSIRNSGFSACKYNLESVQFVATFWYPVTLSAKKQLRHLHLYLKQPGSGIRASLALTMASAWLILVNMFYSPFPLSWPFLRWDDYAWCKLKSSQL